MTVAELAREMATLMQDGYGAAPVRIEESVIGYEGIEGELVDIFYTTDPEGPVTLLGMAATNDQH